MTEQDWLTSDNPAAMLAQFVPPGGRSSGLGVELQSFPISNRKLRLWATAWWSQWQPHEQVHALRIKEVLEGKQDWRRLVAELSPRGLADPERRKVEALQPVGAALLREVRGNPFRPVVLPKVRVEVEADPEGGYPAGYRLECPWLTPASLALARSAYEERVDVECGRCKGTGQVGAIGAPGRRMGGVPCPDCHGSGFAFHGALDPATLAVLADALEEAGCTDEFLLSHLRGLELIPDGEMPNKYRWHRLRGPHVRGCWAVDALWDKEAAG